MCIRDSTEYVFNSTESERSSAAAHGLLSADDSCASPDACGLPADLRAGLPLVLRVSVTPVVYLMAMISFVGWFFFVLFGGIGLAAMPMDLLVGFTKRPQPIDVQEYAKQKLLLNERARPQDAEAVRRAAQFGHAIRPAQFGPRNSEQVRRSSAQFSDGGLSSTHLSLIHI